MLSCMVWAAVLPLTARIGAMNVVAKSSLLSMSGTYKIRTYTQKLTCGLWHLPDL